MDLYCGDRVRVEEECGDWYKGYVLDARLVCASGRMAVWKGVVGNAVRVVHLVQRCVVCFFVLLRFVVCWAFGLAAFVWLCGMEWWNRWHSVVRGAFWREEEATDFSSASSFLPFAFSQTRRAGIFPKSFIHLRKSSLTASASMDASLAAKKPLPSLPTAPRKPSNGNRFVACACVVSQHR